MSAWVTCLRCDAEADGLFCLSCELEIRSGEGAVMARLVPEPGAVAVSNDPDVRGHAVLTEAGTGFPGLCHCPLGEAHRAEVPQ